jgi:hypothetical protein
MQTYFTIFDRDSDQIGFGKAVHTTDEVLLQYDKNGKFRKKVVFERN